MKHFHFGSISSTNDYAKELLKTDSPVFVSADYQWQGRGRNKNKWQGRFGENVFCSVGISHNEPLELSRTVLFQAVGCLAAKYVLNQFANGHVFYLKYPNDILTRMDKGKFKKICGVLTEHGYIGTTCIYSIIGIGINVLQHEFDDNLKDKAISLKMLGIDTTPNEIINKLNQKIGKMLLEKPDRIFSLWKSELNIVGREVKIKGSDIIWEIADMGSDGRLIAINKSYGLNKIIDNGDSLRYNFG